MKYDTLHQLANAFNSGQLSQGARLVLDNDITFVYDDGEKVFEMHPGDVTDQALSMLGIPVSYA